jgi:hypothetical protein
MLLDVFNQGNPLVFGELTLKHLTPQLASISKRAVYKPEPGQPGLPVGSSGSSALHLEQ